MNRSAIVEMLESGAHNGVVLERLAESDASAYTLRRAGRLIESALQDLRAVPSSAARDCLESIAHLCVKRAA